MLYSLHSSIIFLTLATLIFLLLWVASMFELIHAGHYDKKAQDNGELRKEDLIAVMFDFCGILYTGGALSFALLLTRISKTYMALICLSNWACDSMAMFFGKQFGRFKLNRKLSPNKTVEGALGAVFGGCAAALILRGIFIFGQGQNWWQLGEIPEWTVFAIQGSILGALGIVGDLVKSYVKRIAKIKDSGTFFGSHGGVIDRIDGLLFSFPVMFILLVLRKALSNGAEGFF